MIPSDFSNVSFDEEDLEIFFHYKGNKYMLVIDFDEEGFILPTFYHETREKDKYKCYHCSPYILPKKVRENGAYYSISPYSQECMYLNPIADEPMRCLFKHDQLKEKTKKWLKKIK